MKKLKSRIPPRVENFRKCLLKVGDEVKIITGKHKGETGKIIDFDRKRGRIKIEGKNLLTHFVKKDPARNQAGGIEQKEGYLNISNVMFLEKGKTVRLGKNNDGKRISRKTGEVV